ncbi:MAG: mandelate racemase/muconate lactonizing enzyme family protein [Acidobacteriota bacterium]
MRIDEIRIHKLAGELDRRFGWSLNWTTTRTATLVEVRTNDGLIGWGDGMWAEARLRAHPELVLGRSPFDVEAIYDDLRTLPVAQRRRGDVACGGLDAALWDLCGKVHGVPVWKLLGRKVRDRVQPYLTALYMQDWPDAAQGLAEEALHWKSLGYRAMKMKVGYDPEKDVRLVRAVRQAIGPDVSLGVDANCAYDSGTALRLCGQLEQFDPMWFEEPVLADDLAGYDRLRAGTRIPLAGGETATLDTLVMDYVQPRRVDVLQPEVEIIGLTGAKRLSYLCWLNRIRLAPHNWGTAVRTAAILHWMAITPPLTEALNGAPQLFEFDQTASPFRETVIRERLAPEDDGLLAIPTEPGLGVTVNAGEVARYRVEEIVLR